MTKKHLSKIAFYSEKGRVGKTPQALEFALRYDYNFATNQNRHREDIQSILSEERFLHIEPNEEFPILKKDFNIVFDLAGELVGYENSIVSALEQAEVIVIPVVNELDALESTALAIAELSSLATITKNIVIVANMIRKPKDLSRIQEVLKGKIDKNIPIVPVRYSMAFEHQVSEKCSIEKLITQGGLYKHNFKGVCADLDNLFSYLK